MLAGSFFQRIETYDHINLDAPNKMSSKASK